MTATAETTIDLWEELKQKVRLFPPANYNEPFDAFCEALLYAHILTGEDARLVKGLLAQWRANFK